MKIKITQTYTIIYDPDMENYPEGSGIDEVIREEKANYDEYPLGYSDYFADVESTISFEAIEEK